MIHDNMFIKHDVFPNPISIKRIMGMLSMISCKYFKIKSTMVQVLLSQLNQVT